jgi:hypothetical protein
MNKFRADAICGEFLFAKSLIFTNSHGNARDLAYCDGVSIKRVTKELLAKVPKEYAWDGSLVGIDEWTMVHFVVEEPMEYITGRRKEGVLTELPSAVRCHVHTGSNRAHEGEHESQGETILEAIYRLGITETLRYIVIVRGGYNVVESYSRPNWEATIYKPAKDFTLADAIAEARKEARAAVVAESAF